MGLLTTLQSVDPRCHHQKYNQYKYGRTVVHCSAMDSFQFGNGAGVEETPENWTSCLLRKEECEASADEFDLDGCIGYCILPQIYFLRNLSGLS
ncbi:hypothetical protein AB6A40_003286 [Gnathostoma spinigerum]|uniref:Uncharacterized protein n=1 Tax=Gnathostoma spinigerum TaxID=75299 RepID=A0ABD6EIT7_9BILA